MDYFSPRAFGGGLRRRAGLGDPTAGLPGSLSGLANSCPAPHTQLLQNTANTTASSARGGGDLPTATGVAQQSFANVTQCGQAFAAPYIAQGRAIWTQVNTSYNNISAAVQSGNVSQGLAGMLALGTLVASNLPASQCEQMVSAALQGGSLGLSTGAAIGTIVPGFGTAIGAAVGAIIGIVSGLITAAASSSTNPLPIYNQIAEHLPVPLGPNGPSVAAGENSAGAALLLWHCWINGMGVPGDNNFGSLVSGAFSPGAALAVTIAANDMTAMAGNGPGAAVYAYAAGSGLLWNRDDPTKGTLLNDTGANANQLRAIIKTFLSWCPRGSVTNGQFSPSGTNLPAGWPNGKAAGGIVDLNLDSSGNQLEPSSVEPESPIFLPDPNDQYGWWLNWKLWQMAASGCSTLDVYHFCLMQQHCMHVNGGPDPEPHLSYLIGRLGTQYMATAPTVTAANATNPATAGLLAAAAVFAAPFAYSRVTGRPVASILGGLRRIPLLRRL